MSVDPHGCRAGRCLQLWRLTHAGFLHAWVGTDDFFAGQGMQCFPALRAVPCPSSAIALLLTLLILLILLLQA